MLDVTVKTLDGKNRTFSVPDDITVKEFKEKIAGSIDIRAEDQRLIFTGRVLQDEKKINDYDVNGKTIHVVERPPPSVRNQTGTSSASPSASGGADHRGPGGPNVVVGSFQIPSATGEPTNVENIVQQALSGIGNMGRNARVSTRTSPDGSSLNVHINLGEVQLNRERPESEGQRRITGARKMLVRARNILDKIENPTAASTSSSSSSTTSEAQATNNPDVSEGATAGINTTSQPGIDDSMEGLNEDELGVQAIATIAVTETVEAEIQMETEENGETVASTLRIPAEGASNTVEVQTEPRPGAPRVDTGVQTETSNTQPEHPPPSAYADVLDEVFELNRRLQPHMERYQRMLREDPRFDSQDQESQNAQKFYNQISSIMHFISHAYHSLSDLMIDMHQAPPRQLRATPVPMSAVMQHAIPIQTSVSMVQVPVNVGARTQTSTGNTTAANTTGTSTSQSTSQSSTTSTSTAAAGSATATASATASTGPPPSSTPFPPGGQFGVPPPGAFAAGTGRPPFMPPDVFENIIRMATTASVQQHFNVEGAVPRPQGQAFVVRQPINIMPVPGSIPTPPQAPQPTPQTSPGVNTRPSNPTGNQQQPRGVTIAIPQGGNPGLPGMLPGLPQGLPPINAVDPLLPCHSRHFLTRRAVNMARQGAGRGGSAANNNNGDIAGMVSNIVGGLMGQPPPQGANINPTTQPGASSTTNATATNPGPRPQVNNPFAALFGGNVSAPMPGSNQGQAGSGGGSFVDQLRTVLEMGQSFATSSATSTTTTPASQSTAGSNRSQPAPTGSNRSQPVTDDMFTQLVSGIGQYVGQVTAGQTPSGNIADFLGSLGESYVTPEGESLLTDIFNVVSRSINIVDLMQLFSGVSDSLQRTREPLQTYIRTHLMTGDDPTQENIDQCVNRLMADATPYIEQSCTNLETVDDIDFEATLNTFLENHLQDLIVFIMNSSEEDTEFHSTLYTRIRRLIHEALVLSEHCLQGGFPAVTRLVHSRIGEMATDVNPLIRRWMADVTVQQLINLRPNITVTSAEIQPYVVKKSHHEQQKMETSSHSSEEAFMSADEEGPDTKDKKPEAGDNKPEKAQKTRSKAQTAPTCSKSSHSTSNGVKPKVHIPRGPDDRIIPRVAPEGGANPPRQTEGAKLYNQSGELLDCESPHSAARLRPQMTPMAYHTVRCAHPPSDDGNPPEVKLGSEDWHSVVPQEWVSVITQDIERQKGQEKQKAMSDAYMNGNPAKKRKISRFSKSESEQLSEPESSLPEALQFSASVVGAEPITSNQSLARDIAENTTLQHAFHQEVRNEVRKKLRDETDLVPYKYRNTEKYFGNKK